MPTQIGVQPLGYSREALARVNHKAIELLNNIRSECESERTKMVISGCIGPRGDGYNPGDMMSEKEAERNHTTQIETLSKTDADLVSAFTMTYVEEAIGLANAAKSAGMPVVISFTVETDGRLPTGQALNDAIHEVDEATNNSPACYIINCAHPTHFQDALAAGGPCLQRIRGIRANASTKSHAELDAAEELDDGDPVELGGQYSGLRRTLHHLNVLGGCCGTDHRHLEESSKAHLSQR